MLLILLITFLSLCQISYTADHNYESKLYQALLDNSDYDPRAPPETLNSTGGLQLQVEIQLEIMGLEEFDKDSSQVTFKAAFREWWNDTRLSWNPADYGGAQYVWITTDTDPLQIWLPDVIVREDVGDGYLSDFKKTSVKIRYDGLHYWTRLGELKVVSSFDFTDYPFDQQTINMSFGSWLYSDERMRLQEYSRGQPFVIQDPNNWLIINAEWKFIESSVKPLLLLSPQGDRTYYQFQVVIQREGGTMLVAMIIPGCLVAALGSLYYLLPRGSGERVSYLATIMLTEIMFLVMITQFVPQSKIVPLIAYLFLSQTVLLACLTFIVLILDKTQTARDKLKEKKLSEMELILEQIQVRKQSVANQKGAHYGINEQTNDGGKRSIYQSDENDDIENLLKKEVDEKQLLADQKYKMQFDKNMDRIDLIIFILNLIAFVVITAINLRSVY